MLRLHPPGGTATIIGMIPVGQKIELDGRMFLREKKIQGSSMGCNRFKVDMPKYIDFYLQGRLKLDEMITRRGEARRRQRGVPRHEGGRGRAHRPDALTMEPTRMDRRELLKAATAAAAAGLIAGRVRPAAAQAVKWSAGTEAPKLKAPANATDCHHHIYDAKYPVDPKATLRPADALVEDYRALQKRIGTTRNVIVQPSTYGIDNRPTLDALAAMGPTARAVVVVNDTVTDAELQRMHAMGARGIRFNLAQAGATTPEMIAAPVGAGERARLAHPDQRAAGQDHGGDADPGAGGVAHRVRSPGPHPAARRGKRSAFPKVLALIDKGRTWVKLSGAYADTKVGPPSYSDSSAVARAYAKAAPERCVWGSDWPHPTEKDKPDDALLFDLLTDWVPDEKVRHRVLVENPAALYQF